MLPPKGRIAEVGSWRGHFAKHIYSRVSRQSCIWSILISRSSIRRSPSTPRDDASGGIHEVLAGFPEGYFDWILCRRDHSYSG